VTSDIEIAGRQNWPRSGPTHDCEQSDFTNQGLRILDT